jgi:hypothetical protein
VKMMRSSAERRGAAARRGGAIRDDVFDGDHVRALLHAGWSSAK